MIRFSHFKGGGGDGGGCWDGLKRGKEQESYLNELWPVLSD
jgi:hypothetical protein